ncbi:MAG: hypothetical protein ACMUIP_12980 [bacterium]
MPRHYLLVLIPIFFVMAGQTLSKYGAQEIKETNTLINAYITLGYTSLLLRGFVWILILKKIKLSFAYPLMSVTFILILGISYFFFNEEITFYNLLGCFLIMGGVAFIGLGEINEKVEKND